jgi:hypothetical protein
VPELTSIWAKLDLPWSQIMNLRPLGFLLATLALSGCVTQPKFSEAGFPRTDVDIEIRAIQQQIEAEGSNTASPAIAAFGLVGLAIGLGVDSRAGRLAEEAIEPLREKLIDYAIAERFAERIDQSGVSGLLVEGIAPVILTDADQLSERSLARPVIALSPEVRFSNDIRSLVVDFSIYELIPSDRGRTYKVGLRQSFSFRWALKNRRNLNRKQAAEAWNRLAADELVELIELGMDETLAMAVALLNERELHFADPKAVLRVDLPYTYRLWRRSENLQWLVPRSGIGAIIAAPWHGITSSR